MTYDEPRLDDARSSRCSRSRPEGAMVMVHAENSDCMPGSPSELDRPGRTAPAFTRPRGRWRSSARPRTAPSPSSELVDVPILIVHVSGARGGGADPLGAGARPAHLRRDLPAVPRSDRGSPRHARLRGGEVRLQPAAARRGNQQRLWDGLADGRLPGLSSDHAPFRFDDPQGKKGGTEAPFPRFRTASRASRRACRCSSPRACAGPYRP